MSPDEISALIRDRATAHGVDPDALVRIAQIESGLNPSVQAKTSSATGLFQFISPTWGRYGAGADPRDPNANADAGARFTRDNIKALTSAGIQVTPGSTYLAHFAGPQGAVNVLKADPSSSVESVLGANVVKANPFLRGMTIADMRGWADRKMGGKSTAVPPGGVPEGGPYNTGGAGVDPYQVAPPMLSPSAPNMQMPPNFPFGLMAPEPEPPKRTKLDPLGLLTAMQARPQRRV